MVQYKTAAEKEAALMRRANEELALMLSTGSITKVQSGFEAGLVANGIPKAFLKRVALQQGDETLRFYVTDETDNYFATYLAGYMARVLGELENTPQPPAHGTWGWAVSVMRAGGNVCLPGWDPSEYINVKDDYVFLFLRRARPVSYSPNLSDFEREDWEVYKGAVYEP